MNDKEESAPQPTAGEIIHRRVLFDGRVQGVGFRATAVMLAKDFTVAGEVRNLPDGRVRMLVEGKPDQLDGLLMAIRRRMERHITECHVDQTGSITGQWGPPRPGGLVVAY